MRQKDSMIFTVSAVIIVIVGGVLLILSLMNNPALSSPTIGEPSTIHDPVPQVTVPVAVNATTTIGNKSSIMSREAAIKIIRKDYSEYTYSISRIELTNQYQGKPLYSVELVPDPSLGSLRNETVFIDAMTGDYYNPAQDDAKIPIEKAKDLARGMFPRLIPDRVKMIFSDGSQYLRGWIFTLYRDDRKLVQGSLDADTGELNSYSMGIPHQDRPGTPSVTMDAARETADKEIQERNGELPLVLAEARLDPLGMPDEKIAGKYTFVYKRIIHGVPCASDGILIAVDSIAGNVAGYDKSWSLPEDAVALPADPVVLKETAIATVQKEADKISPASTASLRIVSAELRWKDFHNQDRVTPKPGSIPLAWEVRFDDDSIRAQQWPVPATGWVDARTGTLLDLNYHH